MKTIEIHVSPKGETTVETKGFTGTACRDASRALERALGARTEERLTSEFYQGQATDQPLEQSQ